MTRFEIQFTGTLVYHGADPTDPNLEAFIDSVVAELEKIYAEDIDVSTNLTTRNVSVSISLDAEDLFTAQVGGGGTIRTALHAAGAATPAWSIDWVKATTVPEDELIDA